VAGVSDGPPHTTPGVDALEGRNMYLGCGKINEQNIVFLFIIVALDLPLILVRGIGQKNPSTSILQLFSCEVYFYGP
jgi:hypothetical protein